MRKLLKFLSALWMVTCLCLPALASENPTYQVYIDDKADLLTDAQEQQLAIELKELTTWGHAAFISCNENSLSATSYSQNWSYEHFHNQSGVVFLIDMDNREIIMSTTGDIEKIVTRNFINSVCDNVYTYASKKDYYSCASKAFSQVITLMQGQKIAQPMKHINSGLLAIISAILINFLIVYMSSSKMSANDRKILSGVIRQLEIKDMDVSYSHTTKTYSPASSSSSGSSGSSGGGGGGGGGGFSGSSGGHSF